MSNIQQNIQQQWSSLVGAGPRVMELKGDAFANALVQAMDTFANTLSAEYGVNVKEINWQRNQPEQSQR